MSKILWLSLIVALLMPAMPGVASVDWQERTWMNLEDSPLEVAVTGDGRQVFVLTAAGEILAYGADGSLQGKIPVGKGVTGLELLPGDGQLLLVSGKEKALKILEVTVVQTINTEGAPVKGPENAPVSIVVFDDFQCPYCARLVPVLDEVLEKYPKEVKLVFKNFPLRNHQYARKAALAALAARDQGKFWAYHDLLFANYSQLDDGKFNQFAEQLGLDMQRFEASLQDRDNWAQLSRDAQDGVAAGVRGTPTVFINGRQLKSKSPEAFSSMIEDELEKIRKK